MENKDASVVHTPQAEDIALPIFTEDYVYLIALLVDLVGGTVDRLNGIAHAGIYLARNLCRNLQPHATAMGLSLFSVLKLPTAVVVAVRDVVAHGDTLG